MMLLSTSAASGTSTSAGLALLPSRIITAHVMRMIKGIATQLRMAATTSPVPGPLTCRQALSTPPAPTGGATRALPGSDFEPPLSVLAIISTSVFTWLACW